MTGLPLYLCNEVVRELDFAAQCDLAAALGYDGLELAPFTLGDDPHRLPAAKRRELKRAASDAGIVIGALHWLLVTPNGLSITTDDEAVRAKTLAVMEGLIELCADLGGEVLVHGSPAQRRLPEEPSAAAAAADRAVDALAAAAGWAQTAGVSYCLEPLAPPEANFVNTIAEAAAIVKKVGSPSLRTMLDCRAARLGEDASVPELIRAWVPEGMVRHVHLNDSNSRAPGQGDDTFGDVLAALEEVGYRWAAGVEPFAYVPDGPTQAARAIGYLHGLRERRVPR